MTDLLRRLAAAFATEVAAFHPDADLVAYRDELDLLRQAHLALIDAGQPGLDDDTLDTLERIAVAVEARPAFENA